MSENYGLTSKDFEAVKKKLAKQKNYLESFTFLNDNGEERTLLDYSFSANLSKRYYPRILNKVNTFVSIAINKDLTPLFLTMTLDGFFRDMMQGDYTRFYRSLMDFQDFKAGKKMPKRYKPIDYTKHIPNNDRNGKYLDYMINGSYSDLRSKKTYGKPLTPRDLYKIMSHQMHRFSRSKTLQDIRQKYDLDYMMIRVTEPHKDGVPHFHVLMYVPEQFIPKLYFEFHRFFPAPRNAKPINYREDNRYPLEVFPDHYETKGFQTEIRSPAGYILKYILKSFRNLVEGKELDYLQAWYIHNKIPRIITTHSLIAQDVYHYAALLDDDWYYLTNIKLEHIFEQNRALNTFLLSDGKRELIYQNGYYKLTNNGVVIKEFGEDRTYKMKFIEECPLIIPKHKLFVADNILTRIYKFWRLTPKPKYRYTINTPEFIDIQLPNGSFIVYDKTTGQYGRHRDFIKTFTPDTPVLLPGMVSNDRLSDLDLFDWFYNYDFDRDGLKRFATLKKEMISRGLLELEKVNYDDYTTNDFKDFVRSKKRSLTNRVDFGKYSSKFLLKLYFRDYNSIIDFTFQSRLKLELDRRSLLDFGTGRLTGAIQFYI